MAASTRHTVASAAVQIGSEPCNLVVIDNDTLGCENQYDTCTVPTDIMIAPNLPWWSNSRQQTVTIDCTGPEDIVCTDFPTKSSPVRVSCAQRMAGNCGGDSSSGCVSGFTDLGGYCGRSYAFQNRCAGFGYDQDSCTCPDGIDTSPIVVDVDHSGFSMTAAWNGVVFNILSDGVPLPISWTAPSSTNALLGLDRNGNGSIDNGTELFGNLTPQPPSSSPNGFLALAP